MSKIRIHYKMNKPQREFQSDTQTKFLHLSGGYGLGKTTGLVMKGLHLSFLNQPHPGGLLVTNFRDYKRDVLPIIIDTFLQNNIPYSYHKTDHLFTFPWSRGGLYVASSENRLAGPNWAYGLVNELTLIPCERYKYLIGRVRVQGAQCPQIA